MVSQEFSSIFVQLGTALLANKPVSMYCVYQESFITVDTPGLHKIKKKCIAVMKSSSSLWCLKEDITPSEAIVLYFPVREWPEL